ncbi:hypothetical protein [Limosilactobacillus reuteri]|nr:hypothetical protein [Limosilactobacillus reuteri]
MVFGKQLQRKISKTWDALELVNSVVGLAMVLLLSLFIHRL